MQMHVHILLNIFKSIIPYFDFKFNTRLRSKGREL